MLKRIGIAIIAIIMTMGIFSSVKADEKKNYLEVIKESAETKYLENKQGYITKKITEVNRDAGEVTIELKLVNNSEKVEEIIHKGNGKNTEIYLIVDESGSMYTKLSSGKSRRETVRNSSKVLAKSILDKYENVKIGIIKFADEIKMTSQLTNNIEQLNSAIDTYTGGGTNLYDALVLAKNSYSNNDVNKLAIILTDGEPNSASVSKDEDGKYISAAEITKRELINLQNLGINIITMMTEVSSPTSVEKVFGTPENPTAGKYYYIADSKIEEIIENNIYSDIIEQIHVTNPPIDEIKIVDYFPKDITDNFDFSYEGEPTLGEVTDDIDEEEKSITWNMEKLEGDKEASLKYKLKLKDMNNAELLEKEIATNEVVVLTYKDKEAKEYTVRLENSPHIKLTKEKDPEPTPTPVSDDELKKDDTIADKPIPQTGENIIIISTLGLIIMIGALAIIQYKKNNYK